MLILNILEMLLDNIFQNDYLNISGLITSQNPVRELSSWGSLHILLDQLC